MKKPIKLVCVNAWGGRLLKPFLDYLKVADADIYCIQEVLDSSVQWDDDVYCPNLLDRIKETLPNHEVFYTAVADDYFFEREVKHHVTYGNAIFVRKSIVTAKSEEHFVFLERHGPPFAKWAIDQPRAVQLLEIPELNLWLVHFHGLVTGTPYKGDSPVMLEQSRKVRAHMQNKRVILCGDFNMTAQCESLRILDRGMRNLIIEHGISSTRNHYWKHEDKYSDYIIVPEDLEIKKFTVPEIEVSDHLALELEFLTE